MEFPPPPPPANPLPFWRRRAVGLAALALLLYAAFLGHYVDACAGGSDSSGYLNHARILATGHVHVLPHAIAGVPEGQFSDYLYAPLGMKPAPNGHGLVPTYPAGLPLLILAALPLGGWAHASDVVMVAHALAGVLLTFALGRMFGVAPRWSALGAALLAANPLYISFTMQAMSDVPAVAWATAVALAAWRARERPTWALAAGVALSIAVLIRPNNVLMVAPICVAWWPERRALSPLRQFLLRLGFLALGGLPGGIFFCLHGMAAYGKLFTTGYGDTGSLFESRLIHETLVHYLRWLPALFSPLVCLFALLPWAGRGARRSAVFLGVWALGYLSFYASYVFTHETWWYLRFLLPAAPALMIGSMKMASRLAGAKALDRFRPAVASPAVFLVLAVLMVNEEAHWDIKFDAVSFGRGEAVYSRAAQWLNTHAPADTILTVMQTSGAMFYYTDFALVRWDQFYPPQFPLLLAAANSSHRPIYAPLFDFETADFMQRLPGHWDKMERFAPITIWRWAGPVAAP